jgi:hypothetical protein
MIDTSNLSVRPDQAQAVVGNVAAGYLLPTDGKILRRVGEQSSIGG